MRIIFPQNPMIPKEADEHYQEEFKALKERGVECSLFDFDMLSLGEFRPKPQIEAGDQVMYRGWMLSPELYEKLEELVLKKGGNLLTSYDGYLRCHHLPGWYEKCQDYTAKTVFFPFDENIRNNIASLGWSSYFIKDYVKSNSNEKGSIANTPEEAVEVIELIEKYRGSVEGGISVREVERYSQDTEQRYFVINGKVYSPDTTIPDVLQKISNSIDSKFFAADLIKNEDGLWRLVEIGDGQVSDIKNWPFEKFINMIVENTSS